MKPVSFSVHGDTRHPSRPVTQIHPGLRSGVTPVTPKVVVGGSYGAMGVVATGVATLRVAAAVREVLR